MRGEREMTEILDRLTRIERSLEGFIAEVRQSNRDTLDLPAASNYLDVSKSHLYQLTCKNQIPHYKPGGKKVYFDKADLDSYIRRNRID
jgi:excisionase family DNA binding protein